MKSVVEVNSSFDELGSIDVAYLAKQFRRFMRNSRNRGFQKNSKKPELLEKEQTKNLKSSKDKSNQSVNNSLGQQGFGDTRLNVPLT